VNEKCNHQTLLQGSAPGRASKRGQTGRPGGQIIKLAGRLFNVWLQLGTEPDAIDVSTIVYLAESIKAFAL
jgi:hypothetical protein